MMISRMSRVLSLWGVAAALIVVLVGCGRGNSSEQADGKAGPADHKAQDAKAEPHDDEGVVELSPEAMSVSVQVSRL